MPLPAPIAIDTSPAPPGRMARIEWLLLLAALIAVVLVYPLRLHDSLLIRLGLGEGTPVAERLMPAWFIDQFRAMLTFYYSPLILKGVLAGYCLIAFTGVRVARWCLDPAALAREHDPSTVPFLGGPRWWLSAMAFFGWLAASGLWSVTRDVAHAGSVYALVYGVGFWLVLQRGFTRRELRTLAWVLVLLGAAAMAYLAALNEPRLLGRWISNPFSGADEVRNRFGTLLGHNTAAASYLLLTWFMALALLLTSTVRWRRAFLLVYLIAVICAVLIMQSRTVWILAPILGLLALRNVLRTHLFQHWRRLPFFISLILILGVAAQLVDRPWNPLFVRDNPFIKRLQAFTPAALVEESRVRLNIISIRLIPEAPLIGHGMFAYQYVYSRAQNDYFAAHPESVLNRTLARSHMAHNDYLQIWIEQGTIGLALCFWMLISLMRAGRRRIAELQLDASERALHGAFGWGALLFALHGFVDFPFHIPQLALPGLLCLAGWATIRRGRIATAAAVPVAAREGVILSTQLRPRVLLQLVGAAVALGAIPFAALPLARLLAADTLFNYGQAFMTPIYSARGSMDPVERVNNINRALRKFDAAAALSPAYALVDFSAAQAYSLLCSTHAQAVTSPQVPAEMKPAALAEALRTADKSLKLTDQATRGLDFYLMYFLRAQVYAELETLARARPGQTPRSAAEYRNLRRQQLELTVRYATSFTPALVQLHDLLAADPLTSPARLEKLRREIFRWHPEIGFFNRFIAPATTRMQQGLFAQGVEALASAFEAGLPQASWVTDAATGYLFLGDVNAARRLLAKLNERDPQGWRDSGAGLISCLIQRDWIGVMLELNKLPWGQSFKSSARWRALEVILDDHLNRHGWAQRFPRPTPLDDSAWQTLIAAERPYWLALMQDWPAARAALEDYLNRATEPDVVTLAQGVQVARNLHDAAFEQRLLDAIRDRDPRHPLLNPAR